MENPHDGPHPSAPRPDSAGRPFPTDLSDAEFARIAAAAEAYLPGIRRTIPEDRLRAYLNALLRRAVFRQPWRSIRHARGTYKLYLRLRRSGALQAVGELVGFSLEIDRRRSGRARKLPERFQDRPGRPRVCPACPACGAEALCVIGTRRRGHITTRRVACSVCGRRATWVEAGDHRFFRVQNAANPDNEAGAGREA